MRDVCPAPIRVDRAGHSWRFDGDDPRLVCAGCGERRDALTGHTISDYVTPLSAGGSLGPENVGVVSRMESVSRPVPARPARVTLIVAPTVLVGRALAEREFGDRPKQFRWWLVTPRSQAKARGRVADVLLVAPEMVSDKRLPALLMEIAPCFATSSSIAAGPA